jgi:hypothetical protein
LASVLQVSEREALEKHTSGLLRVMDAYSEPVLEPLWILFFNFGTSGLRAELASERSANDSLHAVTLMGLLIVVQRRESCL